MKVVRTVTTKTTVIVDGSSVKTFKTVVDQDGSKTTSEAEAKEGAAIDEAFDEFDKSMDSFDLGGKIDSLMKDAFRPFDRLRDRLRDIGK